MIYITFTGNNIFEETKYYFEKEPDDFIYDNCVQAAVIHKYGDDLESIFVFKTNAPKCDINFDHIREVAKTKNPKIEVKEVLYDLNNTFDELLEKTKDMVNNDDEVILGITNGFRNIPLSIIQIIPYIQAHRNLKLRHFFYGKHDKDTKEVMIQEYVQYFHYSKVIAYLEQFKKSARVPNTLVRTSNDKIDKLLKKMSSLNKQRNRSDIYSELTCLHEVYNLCDELAKEETIYEIYLKEIMKDLKWIKEHNVYFQMNQMAKYMWNKGYYQHAVTILDRNRAVIMSALILGESNNAPKNKKELQKVSGSLIKCLDGTSYKYWEFDETIYFSDISKKKMRQVFPVIRKSKNRKDHFTDIRNIIDHGKSFKNAEDVLSVKNNITNIFNDYLFKINKLAILPMISLENPQVLYVGDKIKSRNKKKGVKK